MSGSVYGEARAVARELERRRSGRVLWCPHTPTPKQAEFLAAPENEVLYGGAAAGGKSDGLLMAALQHVDRPSYSAIIFRRTYADLALPGAIMDRAYEWLAGSGATWNGTKKQWTFPSGARLTFGYLDTDKDRYRYQSAEFQFVGFDELTQFPETSYRYLFSRIRRTTAAGDVPLRMRAATNPGGIGHEWVKRRFIDGPARFIGAKLEDNPHADRESYLESLGKLDSTTRKQLEQGLWVQDTSGLVYHAFSAANLIAAAPAPLSLPSWRYVLGIDFGFHDACAFVIVAYRPGDTTTYVIHAHKQVGMTPSAVGEYVQELSADYKFSRIIGDTGGLGKGYAEEMHERFRIPVEAAEKVNKPGYISLLNGAFERAEVRLLKGSNDALRDELFALAWADDTKRKEADGLDNHLCDALLYAWRASASFRAKGREEPVRGEAWEEAKRDAAERYAMNRKHHDLPKRRDQGETFAFDESMYEEIGP